MSIYLQDNKKTQHEQSIWEYSFSFDEDNLKTFLEWISDIYPKEEVIKVETRFTKETELKSFVSNFFGATHIIEYYGVKDVVSEEFLVGYTKIKIRRQPIICDMINRWLMYKKASDSVSKNHFKDIYLTDFLTELKNWYEGTGITVSQEYSSLDRTLKTRKKDCDSHINQDKKLEIIKKILQNVILKKVECIKLDTLLYTTNLIKDLNIFSSKAAISEITQIVKESEKNYEFLVSIGYNPENMGKHEIVVSNMHGLLANRDMFSRRITHVSKFYNNDNDPEKNDVYFEERLINCNTEFFRLAKAEDIYAYREFYYILDGTRPFLNMTIEEIDAYLEYNC